MTKKSTVIALAAVMFTASALGFNGIAMASDTNIASSWKSSQGNIKNYLKHAPGVVGTVSSINGSQITINSKSNVTYTIDASTAKILKNRNTIISIADIKIGDKVMAQGTVTGTSVVATTVFDGKLVVGKKAQGSFPGVIGIASDINGNTFSVTTKDNKVYTVDATNAKIKKGSLASTAHITDIINGDTVMVRGTVTGTSVVAKTVLDGKLTIKKISKNVNIKKGKRTV